MFLFFPKTSKLTIYKSNREVEVAVQRHQLPQILQEMLALIDLHPDGRVTGVGTSIGTDTYAPCYRLDVPERDVDSLILEMLSRDLNVDITYTI